MISESGLSSTAFCFGDRRIELADRHPGQSKPVMRGGVVRLQGPRLASIHQSQPNFSSTVAQQTGGSMRFRQRIVELERFLYR